MAALPNGLVPELQGYNIGAPDGVVRTPVAGGVARYMLDWDHGVQQFRVSLIVDELQFMVWNAFYRLTLKNGSLPFDMPLDSGLGVSTHTVTILPGSITSSRLDGQISRIAFKVETQSAVYGMSDAAANTYISNYEAANGPLLNKLKPIISGYSMNAPDGVYRSGVAGGLATQALAWDRGTQTFKLSMILMPVDFWAWSVFFHHVAKKGVAAFTMYLDTGLGNATHTVNVIPGTYSVTFTGTVYVVAFTAEAEPQMYGLSQSDQQGILDLYATYGEGLNDLLPRIAQFANFDTLAMP